MLPGSIEIVNQGDFDAAPTYKALRKSDYEDRPRIHKKLSGGKQELSRSRNSLPICPVCLGATTRNPGGYPEPVKCNAPDCHCGFIVPREVAEEATDFGPGTEERVAIMSSRYGNGMPVFNKDDVKEQQDFWDTLCEIPLDVDYDDED